MTAETLAKSTVCKAAIAPAGQTSFLHQFLCDRVQRPSHFFEHHGKLQFQYRLLRIDHHVHRARALEPPNSRPTVTPPRDLFSGTAPAARRKKNRVMCGENCRRPCLYTRSK